MGVLTRLPEGLSDGADGLGHNEDGFEKGMMAATLPRTANPRPRNTILVWLCRAGPDEVERQIAKKLVSRPIRP